MTPTELYRLPLLGPLIRAAVTLVRLPRIVAELNERLARLEGQVQHQDGAADPGFDAFYTAFEERFRGSREAIKERQRVYLPEVAELCRRLDAPVLDIGCGRGEWLELLGENALPARGIESNARAAAICRQFGAEVATGDATRLLAAVPDDSLAVVTAFHVIEHLPLPALFELLDQARRALKTGGMIILETPNPHNLQVGAVSFWFDPTHLRPLPGDTTAFIVEQRGFTEVRILPLHPMPESAARYAEPLMDRLNQLVHGPQDYAVLARK